MKSARSTEKAVKSNRAKRVFAERGPLQSPDQPSHANGWKSPNIEKNNLDFCRFWLAIFVIYSHSYPIAEGHELNEPLVILTGGQLNLGVFSLGCFFSISGFLISHSWLRSKSAVSFLKKRVLRIYPGFAVATLVGFFVVAPMACEHFELTARSIFSMLVNLLALRDFEPADAFTGNPSSGAINGPLWSIPYEFKCYLGLMFLGALGLIAKRKSLMIPVLIFTVIGCAVYPFIQVPALERGAFAAIIGDPMSWSQILSYFIIGMAFYAYRDKVPFSAPLAFGAIIAFFTAARIPHSGIFVFPFATIYCLFWFAFHPSIRLYEWARHGDFSYGAYLFAFPIQQLIVMQMPGISPIRLFLIAAPFSIIAGVLSWHLVEKHFLGRSRRLRLQKAMGSQKYGMLDAETHPASSSIARTAGSY